MAPLTVASVVLSVASCGGGTSGKAPSTPPASVFVSAPDNDRGYDRPSGNERDDGESLRFGRLAGGAEARAVAAMLRRYYQAAAAHDGHGACWLIYSVTARAVTENLGRAPGPPSLRGGTCAVVLSKLFKQYHATLQAARDELKVTAVRVGGDQGVALLKLRGRPQRFVSLRREHGIWKLNSLFDQEIP